MRDPVDTPTIDTAIEIVDRLVMERTDGAIRDALYTVVQYASKARRFRGWRVVWADHPKAKTGLMTRALAHETKGRTGFVVRVYRKAKP